MSMLANMRRIAKYVGAQLEHAYAEHADPKVLDHQRREDAADAARRRRGSAAERLGARHRAELTRSELGAQLERCRNDVARAEAEAETAEAGGDHATATRMRDVAAIFAARAADIEAELAELPGGGDVLDAELLAEHHARLDAIASNATSAAGDAADVGVHPTPELPSDPEERLAAARELLDGREAQRRLAEIRARLDSGAD